MVTTTHIAPSVLITKRCLIKYTLIYVYMLFFTHAFMLIECNQKGKYKDI